MPRSYTPSPKRDSRGPSRSRSRSGSHENRRRVRSPSPAKSPRRSSRADDRGSRRGGGYGGNRDEPAPSRCLGVFGLSRYTTEEVLRDVFGIYGRIEKVDLIKDRPTGESRGFGFIYFDKLEEATEAKERLTGTTVDGKELRVDYSMTKRAHSPTPGEYMGHKTAGRYGGGGYGGGGGRYGDRGDRGGYRDRDYGRSYGGSSRRSYRDDYRAPRRRSYSRSPRRDRRERSRSYSPYR
ncbi:unnamed protein product, partial [Mesorhabditis spiculigera]